MIGGLAITSGFFFTTATGLGRADSVGSADIVGAGVGFFATAAG